MKPNFNHLCRSLEAESTGRPGGGVFFGRFLGTESVFLEVLRFF